MNFLHAQFYTYSTKALVIYFMLTSKFDVILENSIQVFNNNSYIFYYFQIQCSQKNGQLSLKLFLTETHMKPSLIFLSCSIQDMFPINSENKITPLVSKGIFTENGKTHPISVLYYLYTLPIFNNLIYFFGVSNILKTLDCKYIFMNP